jgi:ATP-dependent DNA helicase RecG
LEATVQELRNRGQDYTEIEVKSAHGGVPDVKRTLCAFGNMPSGGVLIFGLEEQSGFKAVGVRDSAALEQGIASQARQAVNPPVRVTFAEASFEDHTLLLAAVDGLPSDQQPCTTSGRAYLRQSDGDYVMSEAEVAQVQARRQRPRFDACEVPGTSVADLDAALVSRFLGEVRLASRRLAPLNDEEVLRNKGVLVHGSTSLTMAGLYALGSYPQRQCPSLAITAAVEGARSERARDLVHLDGPLPEMLDQAIEWVRRNTRTTVRFGVDGRGRDEAEIPMVAVRELIANALVHRDLSPHTQGKRVEIRLRDDLLVIGSPGGLWGLTVDQLGKQGGKSAVNEYLYEICKSVRTSDNARVIEGEGGGIRAVREALRDAGLKPARFIDAGVRFTALLPRHALLPPEDIQWLTSLPQAQSLSDQQKAVAVSMRHGTVWTNPLVRQEFPPIDSTEARALLQGLVAAGIAKTAGAKRGIRYLINDEFRVKPRRSAATIIREIPADSLLLSAPDGLHGMPSEVIKMKNAVPVVSALKSNGPLGIARLVEATGLSRRQVSYALGHLMEQGLVVRNGSQGDKSTTYDLI